MMTQMFFFPNKNFYAGVVYLNEEKKKKTENYEGNQYGL